MHNSCTTKATQSRSGRLQLRMLGHFNRWLQSNGLAAERSIRRQLNATYVAEQIRQAAQQATLRLSLAMLRMLRPGQVETPSSPPSACQTVLRQFQHYLRQERGLSEATIMR